MDIKITLLILVGILGWMFLGSYCMSFWFSEPIKIPGMFVGAMCGIFCCLMLWTIGFIISRWHK